MLCELGFLSVYYSKRKISEMSCLGHISVHISLIARLYNKGILFYCLFVCFAGELALAQNGRASIIVSRTMQESTVEQKYTLIPVHSSTKSD